MPTITLFTRDEVAREYHIAPETGHIIGPVYKTGHTYFNGSPWQAVVLWQEFVIPDRWIHSRHFRDHQPVRVIEITPTLRDALELSPRWKYLTVWLQPGQYNGYSASVQMDWHETLPEG